MRTIKCKECGATITIKENDRLFAFCEYCGNKIDLSDFRTVHQIFDEAEIKKVEYENKLSNKKLNVQIKLLIVSIVLCVSLFIIGSITDNFALTMWACPPALVAIYHAVNITTDNKNNKQK